MEKFVGKSYEGVILVLEAKSGVIHLNLLAKDVKCLQSYVEGDRYFLEIYLKKRKAPIRCEYDSLEKLREVSDLVNDGWLKKQR